MTNDLLVKLLALYRHSSQQTPTEDFTTEALAGILQTDRDLLDRFVNQVLQIPGENFTLETQKRYDNSIIDIQFANSETICFLENKVESGEGLGQLQKYAHLLLDLEAQVEKQVFLRYCTKYYDPKSTEDFDPLPANQFKQLRWVHIFDFVESQAQTHLIQSFTTLLKSLGMSTLPEFNFNDLVALQSFEHTRKKLDECFGMVKPKFIELFGEPYERDYASLKDIPRFSRYALWRRYPQNFPYLEILIAFTLEETPSVVVHCFCNKEHEHYQQYLRALESHKAQLNGVDIFQHEYGHVAAFSKNISDFLSSDNQYQAIEHWFIQHMTLFRDFMDRTPELGWDV